MFPLQSPACRAVHIRIFSRTGLLSKLRLCALYSTHDEIRRATEYRNIKHHIPPLALHRMPAQSSIKSTPNVFGLILKRTLYRRSPNSCIHALQSCTLRHFFSEPKNPVLSIPCRPSSIMVAFGGSMDERRACKASRRYRTPVTRLRLQLAGPSVLAVSPGQRWHREARCDLWQRN